MNGPILRSDINAYMQEAQFVDTLAISDEVFPAYASPIPLGQYLKSRTGAGQLLKTNVRIRTPAGASNRVVSDWESDTFDCARWSVEQLIDRKQAEYTTKFNFDQKVQAAKLLRRQHVIAHEQRVAAQVFNSSNFNLSTSTVAYTAGAAINFPADLWQMKENLTKKGYDPAECTAIIPMQVFDRITQSQALQYYIRGNRPTDSYINFTTPQGMDTFAATLGLKRVLIGKLSVDTSALTQATSNVNVNSSLQFIWNNSYLWLGYLSGGDFSAGGAGRTIYWEQAGAEYQTWEYYVPDRDSDAVCVEMYSAEKTIDTQCGELLATQYA